MAEILAIFAVLWICRKYPVIVSVAGLSILALRVLGFGVGTFVGMFRTYGWRTLLVENWYVALIVVYLPLMGLGWLAWSKLKPRKP